MLKDLAVAFPNTRLKETTTSEILDGYFDINKYYNDTKDLVGNITYMCNTLNNLSCIFDYVDSNESFVVCDLFNINTISEEGLIESIRGALTSIKNFFINLKATIVAFFRRLFDENAKARFTINKLRTEFIKTKSYNAEQRYSALKVLLPSYNDMVNICADLTSLYNDTVSVKDAITVESATIFIKSVGLFGYTIKNGEIVNDTKPRELVTLNRTLGDQSLDWGWGINDDVGDAIKKLEVVAEKHVLLLTSAENLNTISTALNNSCDAAIRTIDKYMAVGDKFRADNIQQSLNIQARKNAFVLKSNSIFQSYVSRISVLLIDVFTNLIAINKHYK